MPHDDPAGRHRFDGYGRLRLEVVREGDRWRVYRLGKGTRRHDRDVVIASQVPAEALADALEVELHELGGPGREIRRL